MLESVAKAAKAAPPASSAPSRPVLREGASGSAVKELQKQLRAAGFDPGAIDGKFGPKTEAAVTRFQKANGLQADGIAGPKTWAALAKTATPPQARATLERGAKGEAVQQLQQKLARAGYSPGAIDGDFGPRTEAALKAFQKAAKLAASGVCTPETWAALEAAKPADTAPGVSDARKRIIAIATGELGLKESGQNRGEILKYPRFFGRGAEAWCADFASWVYTKAGVPLNCASTRTMVANLKAAGKWKTGNPKPGDLVFFDWVKGNGYRGSGLADHVGIVVSVNADGSVNTIEGNAQNSSGVQGVWRHTRRSGILGFGSFAS